MLALVVGGNIVVVFANIGKSVQGRLCFLFEFTGVNSHGSRHGDRDQHPGNGCVNTTLHKGQPHQYAKQQVYERLSDSGDVEQSQQRQNSEADSQTRDMQAFGVEQGDHQDGTKVIDNGQCQQEDFEGQRHAFSQQDQHPNRKRNVGGSGHAPPTDLRCAPIQGGVNQRGAHHPANRGNNGHRCFPHTGQLPHQQLTLDLQADHQKEDGHQSIIDPPMQVVLEGQVVNQDSVRRPHLRPGYRRVNRDARRVHRGPHRDRPPRH